MEASLVLLLVATVCAVHAQPGARPVQPAAVGPTAPTADAATLTIQFDNKKSTVTDSRKTQQVINALAQDVFLVRPTQVTAVGGVDQSRLGGLLGSQSVVSFKAVGPTTNGKSVLANCQANTKEGIIFSSTAQKAVKKATDTWWPGDAVRVQKATCAKA